MYAVQVRVGDTGLDVGAGITLSSLEELLKKQVASLPPHKARGLAAAAEQLRWFAGTSRCNERAHCCTDLKAMGCV